MELDSEAISEIAKEAGELARETSSLYDRLAGKAKADWVWTTAVIRARVRGIDVHAAVRAFGTRKTKGIDAVDADDLIALDLFEHVLQEAEREQ